MSAGGYGRMLRLLGALPCTDVTAAAAAGVKLEAARAWLRWFVQQRVVRIAHKEHVGVRRYVVTYAMRGDDEGTLEPVRRRKDARQPSALVIALSSVLRELRTPQTIAEVVETTGWDRRTLTRVLTDARTCGVAYIAKWERGVTTPTPVWALGRARDAKKPSRTPRKVVQAKAWARRNERLRAQALHDALTLKAA